MAITGARLEDGSVIFNAWGIHTPIESLVSVDAFRRDSLYLAPNSNKIDGIKKYIYYIADDLGQFRIAAKFLLEDGALVFLWDVKSQEMYWARVSDKFLSRIRE